MDWAADSAFRFFPIERDPLFGWRLHLFDLATNKALTLSARTETRDYVDILELHKRFPLAAISDEAAAKMTQLADEQPNVPIGVAFVDVRGRPGWFGDDANLRIHAPSLRGCWPTVHGLEGR